MHLYIIRERGGRLLFEQVKCNYPAPHLSIRDQTEPLWFLGSQYTPHHTRATVLLATVSH